MSYEPDIADLINAKRADGFDGEFEALMRQPWYCPHCKSSKTILETMIPYGHPEHEPACRDCGKEGIKLTKGDYIKQFRKMLNMLAPYNRNSMRS